MACLTYSIPIKAVSLPVTISSVHSKRVALPSAWMGGRGRASDNIFVERLWRSVKHEDVYLKGYGAMTDLMLGLAEYFTFYNTKRMHQSLEYSTPDKVYLTASEGGAKIVDKYSKTERISSEIETKIGAAPFRCMNRVPS